MTRHSLITGGAGFVGSHLAERLIDEGDDVTVVDDRSSGEVAWVPEEARFIEGDLLDREVLDTVVTPDLDRIFHLASHTAVNDPEPRRQFRDNTSMTYDLVTAACKADVPEFVFTSSSTVYGEAPRPTPEDYAPLEPISPYGASKLACEAILSTAAHSRGMTVYNLRFANVVGPRLRGAVIPDFIEKLQDDPTTLRILGNGRQEKSYLHVTDCIEGMLAVCDGGSGPITTVNLGTRTSTSVDRIADIVAETLEIDPTYEYTGGRRGWSGDVTKMGLSIEKATAIGWAPTLESDDAVRTATRELLAEFTENDWPK